MRSVRRRAEVLGVICLAQLTVLLDNTVLNVAIPSLTRELRAATADIQWMMNAYSLVQSGPLLTAGSAADRYGRKKMLVAGLVLFGIGSPAAALADSTGQLIAARAGMGVGGALLLTTTPAAALLRRAERADSGLVVAHQGLSRAAPPRARRCGRRFRSRGRCAMVKAAQGAKGAARTSVWLEGKAPRGGRGGQPSALDRERITEVTVRLLDAEGLAKFSMRRLAAELNVTAMSVYWYVDTKDDLLELALDAAFGELRLREPDEEADWREQLRRLAAEYRALLVCHPWLSPLAGTFLNIGPNALAFSGTARRIIRRTGLPEQRLTGAISAVLQFVYGYGTIEGHFVARCAEAGMPPDDYFRHAMSAATRAPDAAEVLRESAILMAARGGDTVAEMLDRDFAFALDLLVAGIEAMVARG